MRKLSPGARRTALQLAPLVVVATLVAIAASEVGGDRRSRARDRLAGAVTIDGSPAGRPLTESAARGFRAAHPDVRVTVGASGDRSAIDAFCAGELDLATVDRKLGVEEQHDCTAAGTRYASVELAREGIAVVVNDANRFTGCLSVEQLRAIWRRDRPATTWADVSADYPAAELSPIGWKPDSAAHELFAAALFGTAEPRTRDDFEVAGDAAEVLQAVALSPGAIGYLPLGEYRLAPGIQLVAVDGGEGCAKPSARTVHDRSYEALSRPLYLDVSRSSLRRPEVRSFLRSYLRSIRRLSRAAGVVPIASSHRIYWKFTRR
jgi:phosphate transport system substrate-binding protein